LGRSDFRHLFDKPHHQARTGDSVDADIFAGGADFSGVISGVTIVNQKNAPAETLDI